MAGGGGGGKDGDWQCANCHNRNYAFRSVCNRCKQPRILVDSRTPADSKWFPRVGDWICTGCTNNNYASREECKKCGQPKEIAAMPAVALPGASVHTHPAYFSRNHGAVENLLRSGSLIWPLSGIGQYGNLCTGSYGLRPASSWSSGGNSLSGISYAGGTSSFPSLATANCWRTGDWLCTCGFHNYNSRVQCKKCSARKSSLTPTSLVTPASGDQYIFSSTQTLGTKRLASEEFVHNWDNKRLNAGQPLVGFEPFQGGGQVNYMPTAGSSGMSAGPANLQNGKGTKHWRDGDWMCSTCNNHNYASRTHCNRCKSKREVHGESVSVA